MNEKKDTFILGISAYYHDSAAALVKNGEIIAAAQEERFTRKKHDSSFPRNAVEYCLKEGGIKINDVAFVAYYEKPFLKFERLLYTYLAYAPSGLVSFLKAMPIWLKEKIFLKDLLQKELNYSVEFIFPEHHESHAASAFYPSPFKKAAILTMDGVGEWTTASFGLGIDNKIDILGEIKFPHSLGLLYSAFTLYTGFRVNSGEYKLMGLAPYGEGKYTEIIKKELIDIKDDGSFKLNMKYFDYCAGLRMINDKFCKLFGASERKPESPLTQFYMDIAKSIQDVTEDIMLKMAEHVYQETKCENLCLAGGVALNCVGNGEILRKSKFKNIWIQPAAGDAGGALGAAFFGWYLYLENKRNVDGVNDKQKGSLLGPGYNDEVIEGFITRTPTHYVKFDPQEMPRKVAELIAHEKIVGLVQGRMEFGPRALGARSIIADARSEKMQEALNLKTKFRESFRPFAPSVIEEKAKEYFDLENPSPYMLLVAPVSDKQIEKKSRDVNISGIQKLKIKRSTVPAITHVDYSARVQTVSKKTNPLYYTIIEEFNKLTGCPVIINTSFNIRGEPIVESPEDAYRCFMCTNMDFLVMGNYIFEREKQPNKDKYKKADISTILD